MKESLFSKICKGSTPFCIDFDKKDSYIIDSEQKDKKNNQA